MDNPLTHDGETMKSNQRRESNIRRSVGSKPWALFGLVVFLLSSVSTGTLLADQNVVVILDDSGSMDDRMRTDDGRVKKIKAAKEALVGVLANLPPDTNVGVVALNTQVDGSNWVVPLGSNSADWQARVEKIRAVGATPLGQYMKIGADALLEARQAKVYGEYRLLVVTDGEANDGGFLEQVLPDILSRGLMVDVIGVDMQSDHSLATKVHSYRRADDDAALKEALSEVFAETSADDQDINDEFEILASLPDGFAEAALEALASRGNEPVQAIGIDGVPVDADFISTNSNSSSVLGFLCCLGPPLVVFVVFVTILSSLSKRKR